MEGGRRASGNENGNLPPYLVLKLQIYGKTYDHGEIEILRKCLETDPRTEVLMLGAIEKSREDIYQSDIRLFIELLMAQEKVPEALKFFLRSVAFESCGHHGDCTRTGQRHLARLEDIDSRLRWLALATIGLGSNTLELCYPNEYVGRDVIRDSFAFVLDKAFDEPGLSPSLFSGIGHDEGRRRQLLMLLATRSNIDSDSFELGELSTPLQKMRDALKWIDDPLERAKRCELYFGTRDARSGFSECHLSAGDIALLSEAAESEDHVVRCRASERLIERCDSNPVVREWVKARLTSDEDQPDWWMLTVARKSKERELAWSALEKLMQFSPAVDVGDIVARFCSGPWKLPSSEAEALIRPALEAADLDRHGSASYRKWKLWELFLIGYPEKADLVPELLEEIRKGSLGSYAGDLLETLFIRGIGAEEIARMVEGYFESGSEAESNTKKYVLPLRLLHVVDSARAFDRWMEVAMLPDDPVHAEAMYLLSLHFGHDPVVVDLLLQNADSGRDGRYFSSVVSPRDPRVREGLENPPWRWGIHMHSEGFDSFGFDVWCGTAEERRQELMRGVKLADDSHPASSCAWSLAYWFGEDPETLPFLVDRIRESTDEPEGLHGKRIALTDKEREESWRKQKRWSNEPEIRKQCLKVLGYRWPWDERVHGLATEMVAHPWAPVRREAARLLAREYGASSATCDRLESQIARDAEIFGEYVSLMSGDLEGMHVGLRVLSSFKDEPQDGNVAWDGPRFLARTYGPRKDLRAALEGIASETASERLRSSISRLIGKFWA